MEKCFACGRHLLSKAHLVDTRDGQTVYVGPNCYEKILKAKEAGYQPPKGGPRLWLLGGAPQPQSDWAKCECGFLNIFEAQGQCPKCGRSLRTASPSSEVALSASEAQTRYLPLATVLGKGVEVAWSAVEKACAGSGPFADYLVNASPELKAETFGNLFVGDFACLYFGRHPETCIPQERELLIAKMIHELGPAGVRFRD